MHIASISRLALIQNQKSTAMYAEKTDDTCKYLHVGQ